MTEHAAYHVLTRAGDASAQVEALARELRATHGSDAAAGFVRYFYVSQAKMTVVLTAGRDAPVSVALRRRGGWAEPGDEPLGR